MSKALILGVLLLLVVAGIWTLRSRPAVSQAQETTYPVQLSDEQWKAKLSPAAYRILRHESTEAPHSSALDKEKRAGEFSCGGCQKTLFTTADKFDSGTGWPSFSQPATPAAVGSKTERTLFMARTEVHCANCGGHLGHVFNDGPAPTGLRYCINGQALEFVPAGGETPPMPEDT